MQSKLSLLLCISFLHCMDPQPHNHDHFSKISRTLCTTRNWWIIVVFLQCMPKRKITIHSHEHSFTPYPSLSPYWRTEWQTDRETNTLAARGLEELFVHLCCCVSFLFWLEINFGFTYLRTLLNKLFYELIFF